MIDVKKLITGFLILAITAGVSAVIVSSVGYRSSAAAPTQNQTALITGISSSTATDSNAFIPQSDSNSLGNLADSVTVNLPVGVATSTDEDPNNLTNALADSYLGGVIGTNPNGPTFDANGNPVINPPDPTGVAEVVANATATVNLQIPDWDIEASSQPIRVLPSTSPTAVAAYNTALNDIMTSHVTARVQTILSNADAADANDLTYVQSQVQQALGDTLALEIPASLVHFQKDLVRIFVYDKNFFQLLTLAQTDPVKASLIFQGESSNFQLAQQEFQKDSQEIASGTVSLQSNKDSSNILVVAFDHVFGIPTAHAMWPVFDPATWGLISANQWENIQNQLWTVLKNTLLQILKNTLIALVQRKVLVWIQGSGTPRFIRNWSTEIVNAYTQTALKAINSAISCNYSGFATQLNAAIRLPYTGVSGPSCSNPFAKALGGNTLQQFRNNFANGSWLAFGVGSMPTNNYYSSLFFSSQLVDYNGKNAQVAVQAESIASQGTKGDQAACADKSNPNGIIYTCYPPDGKPSFTQNGQCPSGNGWDEDVEANNGLCADGSKPDKTTPGIFTVTAEGAAANSTGQQLAAANDIVGLLNAVAGSLINGLANAAVTAAGNVTNGILSVNPTSIQGGGTAPAAIPLTCNPTTQTILSTASTPPIGTSTANIVPPATISAGGGTLDANNNPPTYSWLATDGATSTDSTFSHVFANPGTYNVTLNDSANDRPVICTVIVQ